jgi:hypothetical protein
MADSISLINKIDKIESNIIIPMSPQDMIAKLQTLYTKPEKQLSSQYMMKRLQAMAAERNMKAYCEGCFKEGTFGSKCSCGSYIMCDNPPPPRIVAPRIIWCPFCKSDEVTSQCPVCYKCKTLYDIQYCGGIPGSINGHTYTVNKVRYYINPYIGRDYKAINYGVWRKCFKTGKLQYVASDDVPKPLLK